MSESIERAIKELDEEAAAALNFAPDFGDFGDEDETQDERKAA